MFTGVQYVWLRLCLIDDIDDTFFCLQKHGHEQEKLKINVRISGSFVEWCVG